MTENLDNPSSVRREQDVRSKMTCLVREFEDWKKSDEMMHQSDYKYDVMALVDAFEQLGNPSLEDSGKLRNLDQSIFTRPVMVDNMSGGRLNAAIQIIYQQASHLSGRGFHCSNTQN